MQPTESSPNYPNTNQAERSLAKVVSVWAPPPRLTLSQWADKYRRTSSEASNETGNWVTRPFQREPMDEFTNPRTRTVVIMSAVQMLKTEFILNAIGYVIHLDPGPVLVIQFRDTDCEIFSKRRLAPMLRDTPILKGLVAESKARDSGNTITDKSFPGGHIRIAASASPGNLAALPIRFLFCDEVDKYPVSAGPEGDPISLAEGRLTEFEGRWKEILTCSPTVAGFSRIEKAYLESDQREYEVPCTICGEFQILKWSQVRWDASLQSRKKQAESAYYECAHCQAHWDDGARWKTVYTGRYRATAPFNGVAGFRINALCSLKKRLSQFVQQFLKVKNDQEQLKTFVNTILAQTWSEPGETLEWERVLERREQYQAGMVPAGGLFLTAAVDVQRADGGRLEARGNAYGENRERGMVDYRIFPGDPTDLSSPKSPWRGVESMLTETWVTESGAELAIERLFVDSGDGAVTPFVYQWVSKQPRPRVWAIKGDKRCDTPVGPPKPVEVTSGGRKLKLGVLFKIVNSDFFKAQFYADLRKRKPTDAEIAQGLGFPQGFVHIPEDERFADEHCRQLCAERLVTKKKRNGRTVSEYEKTYSNEALDTQLYCDAGAWDFGWHRFQRRHFEALRAKVKAPEPTISPGVSLQPIQVPQPAPMPARRKFQIRLG
jgi:phage terminase large subunit GpA-like protein